MTVRQTTWLRIILALLITACTLTLVYAASADAYQDRYTAFINTYPWTNGTSWNGSTHPQSGKKTGWDGTGCFAYAQDFFTEVWGANGYSTFHHAGEQFTDPNAIRRGDIIYLLQSNVRQHYYVVLERYADGTLYTAEGNINKRVEIRTNRYSVSNPSGADTLVKIPFYCGWHMPASASAAPVLTVSSSDRYHTVNLNWSAVPGADCYSIRLYDQAGTRVYLRDDYSYTSFAALLPLVMPEGSTTYQAEVCAVVRNVSVTPSDRVWFDVVTPASSSTPVMHDARILGDKVYKLYSTPVTWLEAKALSENAGGRLAILNTAEKQSAVQEMMTAYDSIAYLGGHGYYYEWQWLDGTAISGYTHWAQDEPNNYNGLESVLMIHPDGTWNDTINDSLYGYVAEFDLTGLSVEPIDIPWLGGAENIRDNLSVTASFSDGSSYIITDYECSAADNGDTISVEVTYCGQSISCVIDAGPLYSITVYCGGSVSRPYVISGQAKAGAVVDLSVFDFYLSDEEKAAYAFGRWEYSGSMVAFADAGIENTTFVMPGYDVAITKVYYHSQPYYSSAVFEAGYGGNLYIYQPEVDTMHTVTGGETLTLSLREGEAFMVSAYPWDFFGFSAWSTEDFWIQYTTETEQLWMPMEGHDTYLKADFFQGPYIIDDSQSLFLPEGLKEIEDEAFLHTAAKFFIVSQGVTRIGHHAFPAGSVVYLAISGIEMPLDAIAQSGTYIDWEETDTCDLARKAAGTAYTVLNCHGLPFDE